MNQIVAKAVDFRFITLAFAGALAFAAGHADARGPGTGGQAVLEEKPHHGGSVKRSRNADGTMNRSVTTVPPRVK